MSQSAYPANTLGKAMGDAIDLRIAGLTAGSSTMNRWTAKGAGASYTPNANLWTDDIDLSPIITSYDGTNAPIPGCMVTKFDGICAQHQRINLGATVRLAKSDGTICERTVSASNVVSGTDINIFTLNAATDDGIGFAHVFPTGVYAKLNGLGYKIVPGLTCHKDERISVGECPQYLLLWPWGYVTYNANLIWPTSGDTLRESFGLPNAVNDSGSSMCAVLGTQLVLLACMRGADYGPSLTYYITEVNAKLALNGRSLTQVNITGYTTPPTLTGNERPYYPDVPCGDSIYTAPTPTVNGQPR